MIEPTDAQIEAASDELWPDLICISEDDNRYCSPPRTRHLTDDETRELVRDMLKAALNA